MSVEACPHCHEQVRKDEDGCGTERCIARRAFVRQAAIGVWREAEDPSQFAACWTIAEALWNAKPEGC